MFFNYLKNKKLEKKLRDIKKGFNISKSSFNVKTIDTKIEQLANEIYRINKTRFSKNIKLNRDTIGALASQLYDTAGHTPCVVNFIKSFYREYNLKLFLGKKPKTIHKTAKERSKKISKFVKIKGIGSKDRVNDAIELYNQIVNSKVKVLFLYTHMDDVITTVVTSLLKKHTGIKIIFFNHADHYPTLGMKFSDLILDARPAGYDLTREDRGYKNNIIVDLQGIPISENILYTKKDIEKQRKKWGLSLNSKISLTGCSSYKLFNKECNSSEYFEMIRDILEENKALYHIVVSIFSAAQSKAIENIFRNHKEAYSRLKIIPFEKKFDILFQSADLFIDSFPQGSALTHIDCMRGKVPTIIKINKRDPFKSFEYYLPEDYKYKFIDTEEMKNAILSLINDKIELKRMGEELYKYYLSRYEFNVVKKQYKEIIEEYKER